MREAAGPVSFFSNFRCDRQLLNSISFYQGTLRTKRRRNNGEDPHHFFCSAGQPGLEAVSKLIMTETSSAVKSQKSGQMVTHPIKRVTVKQVKCRRSAERPSEIFNKISRFSAENRIGGVFFSGPKNCLRSNPISSEQTGFIRRFLISSPFCLALHHLYYLL